MRNHHVMCKLGNMRKLAEFTVYPRKPDDMFLMIQSDTRICRFDLSGNGLLSAARQGGAYGIHLSPQLGATVVQVPADVVAACIDAAPKSGEKLATGLYAA